MSKPIHLLRALVDTLVIGTIHREFSWRNYRRRGLPWTTPGWLYFRVISSQSQFELFLLSQIFISLSFLHLLTHVLLCFNCAYAVPSVFFIFHCYLNYSLMIVVQMSLRCKDGLVLLVISAFRLSVFNGCLCKRALFYFIFN